jgi:hypothetical protein
MMPDIFWLEGLFIKLTKTGIHKAFVEMFLTLTFFDN